MMQTEKVFRVAIVAVTLLFAVSGVSGDTCTNEKFAACRMPMKRVSTKVASPDVASLGLDQVKSVCRLYPEFSSCMKPIKDTCDDAVKAGFASLDGGIGYLCEESTFDEYTKHAECLSKKELEPKITECRSKSSVQTTDKTKACGIFYDYLKCVEAAVTSVCDADAGNVMRDLTEHFLTPVNDCPPLVNGEYNCTTEKVTACLKPLKDVSTKVESADVASLGLDQMKKVCRSYAEFSSCMKHIKDTCDTAKKDRFATIDEGMGYLCEESTFDEYAKHAECLSEKEMEPTRRECATDRSKAQTTDKTKGCMIFSDHWKCVETVVTPVCGADAAKFMRNLDKHFLTPWNEKMGCPPFPMSSGVSRLTCVGTTLLLMVLSALTAIGV